MKTYLVALSAFSIVATVPAHAQTNTPMKLLQTIPLPNVEGYFDHMAVDIKGQRLFLPGEQSPKLPCCRPNSTVSTLRSRST